MTAVPDDTVEIDVDRAVLVCREALISARTPAEIAHRVASSLVANEAAGSASHGLLRLADYLDHIRAGLLDVAARPTVDIRSDSVRVIDGRRGFGVLAADTVTSCLRDMLRTTPLCAVALVNAGHIGRLSDIGEAVARDGKVVLGFVNYLGGGQRVAPWEGRDGRLCTNPLLIAVPAHPAPFVLDMSTSAISEGRIRQHAHAGADVPAGWLVDAAGNDVNDPARLYTNPPTAYMAPLGGAQGYKGFGLAVAVELLAGVIAGAGHAEPGVQRHGNGGLFLGLDPTLAGRALHDVMEDIDSLRAHLTASAPSVRLPGQRATTSSTTILIDRRLWEQTLAHADGKETSAP